MRICDRCIHGESEHHMKRDQQELSPQHPMKCFCQQLNLNLFKLLHLTTTLQEMWGIVEYLSVITGYSQCQTAEGHADK